jgi:hypothetical protein
MASDFDNLLLLMKFAEEFEANSLLHELAANSIDAVVTGGFTAGFRAEAPGSVTVLVRQSDWERARATVLEWERNRGQTDWSSIDVGQPEGL